MAIVTASNYSSPNTVKWASTDADIYDRLTQLAGWMENLDGHDHDTLKGAGVRRLQTASTPTAAGHVQQTGDALVWWGQTAGATRSAVNVEATQTITGAKSIALANAHAALDLTATTGTNGTSLRFNNTGGLGYVGLDNSTATVFGGSAYGLTLFAPSGVELVPGGTAGSRVSLSTAALTVRTTVYVGDTSNASSTLGLTLNQGAADDEIVSLKSSDVAHGMTSLSEDDTYGSLQKHVGATGGLRVTGWSEDISALLLFGYSTGGDTTRSTSAIGAVRVGGDKKNGTTSTALGANENIFVVSTGGGAKFLVDAEGDIHMDATSNINAWDDHDDLALLESYRVVTAAPTDYRLRFATDVDAHARVLHETGVITLNDDGHHFVSVKGMFGLLIDAVRQSGARIAALEARALEAG